MDTKECSGCGLVKPLTEFHRHKKFADGHRPRCKVCRKAETKAWYRRNAVAVRARSKAWREANPERYKQQLKDWVAKPGNAERKREADRAWKLAHQAERKEYSQRPESREYARLNAKTQNARRKLQKGATLHAITKAEWLALQLEYEGRCAYCGVPLEEPTMDHVVPLIKGGDHSVGNIVPACSRCNKRKNDRDVVTFLAELNKEAV
jgi:5-methylcytosine-specific restriction endonuclease McrA